MTAQRPALWLGLLLLLLVSQSAQTQQQDSRLVRSSTSPHWLDAIVRLKVPGVRYQDGQRRHHIEDCSATLVASNPSRRVDTLVTAWHCLEMYRDLGKDLTVTIRDRRGLTLSREVYRLADGGGMHADWAILRMYEAPPIGSVAALGIHPGRADEDRPITMAGFSKDAGLGAGGKFLTFDPACGITAVQRTATATNCAAYKGASGGAVVQMSSRGTPLLTGVISQGNSDNYSSFVPVDRFRSALERHLGGSIQPRF